MSPDPEGPERFLRLFPVHQRIRRRRDNRGWTVTELAERAGISPGYVSLIERGLKIPNEETAARIAEALDDDPALYSDWARGARYASLTGRWGHLRWLDRLAGSAELRSVIESGRDLPRLTDEAPLPQADMAAEAGVDHPRLRDEADQIVSYAKRLAPMRMEYELSPGAIEEAAPEGTPVVEVPLLAEGADPAHTEALGPHDVLRLDSRLLPAAGGLFAYEAGRETVSRLGDLVAPGDYVVLSRRVRRLAPDRIYAVKFRERYVLSRVLFKGVALLLLPGDRRSNFDVIDLPNPSEVPEVVAGVAVLTIRRWS